MLTEGHSVTYGREPSPLPLDGLPKCIYTLFAHPFSLSPSPPAKTIKTIGHTFTLWFACFYRVVLNKVIENRTNRIIKFLGLQSIILNTI